LRCYINSSAVTLRNQTSQGSVVTRLRRGGNLCDGYTECFREIWQWWNFENFG